MVAKKGSCGQQPYRGNVGDDKGSRPPRPLGRGLGRQNGRRNQGR